VLDGSKAFGERVYGKNGRSKVEVRWQSERKSHQLHVFPTLFQFCQMAAMGMKVREEASMYCNYFEFMDPLR
jgi:hypothetical protein